MTERNQTDRQKALMKKREEIKELYKSLAKTTVMVFVSLFTLVFVAVAWFVANSNVHSGSSPISADYEPMKLAVKRNDFRQNADEYLQLNDGDILTDVNGNDYYYTNAGTIALRLDKSNYEVSPGAKGKVTFYVIPNGATSSVTLHIGLGAYGEDENNDVNQINNEVINSLINGHILLFDDYSDVNGYSNWLFETTNNSESIYHNSITVDLSNSSAGDIVPVDFYWIWPTRYENMANDFKGTGISTFLENQTTGMTDISNNYRYSYVYLTDKLDLSSDSDRSKAYDLADEYIGGNAQYLYLTIQTSVTEEAGGMTE